MPALVAGTAACTPGTARAPVAAPTAADVDAVLRVRADAVLASDEARWLRPVDVRASPFRRAQSEAWDVVSRLPVASWRWTRVGGVTRYSSGASARGPADTAPPAPATWSVPVRLDYRLRGTDPQPVHRTSTLLLRREGGAWRLAGEQGVSGSAPWDVAPARVLRRERVLLVVSTRSGSVGQWVAAVAAAGRRVRQVLGPPALTPLVVVPAPPAADVTGGGTAHPLAAVTEGGRVLVTPSGVTQLGQRGRVVVLAHELTHVAMAWVGPARGATVPAWLDEGFADWVGWTGSGVGVRTVAAELFAEVAASGVPAGLPPDSAFDVTRGGSPAAYESGWLACRLLADRGGAARLVAFYRDAQRRGLATALESAYALTPDRLVRLWRAYVWRQAGAARRAD